ncbi:transporter [Klebsiella grimontii]|nr:transporter [Klebsiella grimontii]
MYQQQHIEFIIQKAKKRLDQQEAPGCTKAGWLMITALLIESWDIYSMAFILFALKDIYEPSSWLLGFTAAGTQLGAVVGALLGGWLTDKLGRRKIFLWSMILFAIFAVLQAWRPICTGWRLFAASPGSRWARTWLTALPTLWR